MHERGFSECAPPNRSDGVSRHLAQPVTTRTHGIVTMMPNSKSEGPMFTQSTHIHVNTHTHGSALTTPKSRSEGLMSTGSARTPTHTHTHTLGSSIMTPYKPKRRVHAYSIRTHTRSSSDTHLWAHFRRDMNQHSSQVCCRS